MCSAYQEASNDIHFDLEVTLRSSDLRSTGDLDLIRSPYTYSDAFSMVGTAIFALA